MKNIEVDSVKNVHGDTISLGDLVTAFTKGIHRVIKIERRIIEEGDQHYAEKPGVEVGPLIWYKKVINEQGFAPKGDTRGCCDASYVRPVRYMIEMERQRLSQIAAHVAELEKEFTA